MEKIIVERPQLSKQAAAMTAVDGVGRHTAIRVLAELPEIGRLNRGQVAAVAGVAPFNRDSGGGIGVRHIRGGRAHLRTALFMAAWAVTRQTSNGLLAKFFQRLRSRGKPHRVAVVAVMRKMLVHLDAIARETLQPVSEHEALRDAVLRQADARQRVRSTEPIRA
jgi:transposase